MPAADPSIGQLRSRLEPLLWCLGLGVRPVQRDLLRAVLLGLLRCPGPYVSDVARTLGPEFGPSLDAREARVLRLLNSPKVVFEEVKAAQRRLVSAALPSKGRVYLYGDLSDLSKPSATKMQGLDIVRDASDPDERLGPGYWLNEVYVELERGRLAPVVAELYSLRSGTVLSQTEVVLRGIREAFQVAGSRGVFVADRGFDDGHLFEEFLLSRRDFIIRLKTGVTSRGLLVAHHVRPTVETIVASLPLVLPLHASGVLRRRGRLGWCRVRLPEHSDRDLTLVIAHLDGSARPMAVLTSLPVRDAREAREVVAAYLRRWGSTEDPIRFLKQVFRVEKFLLRRLRAMRLWVFLIACVMGVQGLLLLPGAFSRAVLGRVERFARCVRFAYYRMTRALGEWLSTLSDRDYRSLRGARGP